MSLDTSALSAYVKENEDILLSKSIFGAQTADIIINEGGNLRTGIKSSEKLDILATDAVFQSGDGCTRNPSGNTSLTARTLTVGAIAVVEDICVKTLRANHWSRALVKGSNENTIPFEQEYTDLKTKTIQKQLEKAIWQGDTTSVDVNLNKFDGFIKEIDTAASAVNGNPTGIAVATGITTANVKLIVDNMWSKLPADLKGEDDIRIFAGTDTFDTFLMAYRDQNLFNFTGTGDETKKNNYRVRIPGTSYWLVGVHGLDATNRLFTIRTSNMYLGTDLENEEEKFKLMPDQFDNYLRYEVEFKEGVQVAFPNEIVSFKLV